MYRCTKLQQYAERLHGVERLNVTTLLSAEFCVLYAVAAAYCQPARRIRLNQNVCLTFWVYFSDQATKERSKYLKFSIEFVSYSFII
jgi:hypothetical protein